MSVKRKALSVLSRAELLELGREFELDVTTNMRLAELLDAVAASKRARLDRVLAKVPRDTLKAMCFAIGVSQEGREKDVLRDRILAKNRGDDPDSAPVRPGPEVTKAAQVSAIPAEARAETLAPSDMNDGPRPVGKGTGEVAPPTTSGVQQPLLPWEGFPLLERAAGAPAASVPNATQPRESVGAVKPPSWEITLDVAPRKPRIAWQGMWRKEVAVSVPTQVVEIVRPGRAIKRGEELSLDTRVAEARTGTATSLPPNRLIWTNDNLIALQTLLDEKDPLTRDWRYRGKVDLVYIDPPFMVNNDFRADNSIDIDLDDEQGVQAKKEPSLVEILAYRDTWRQGLDSFLTMLRQRLLLLKDLLAPTGSIYVHLDWHAVHYVKVLMDEIFGYENFTNEIVWKRTSARSDAQGFNQVHDALLVYAVGPGAYWNAVFGPLSADYIRSHYNQVDEQGRRYRLDNLTSPNPRPNMMYEWRGYAPPPFGWRLSRERMAQMDEKGLIHYPKLGGRLSFKRYLDADGMPLQTIWNDLPPVNSQAAERVGYPTQKPVALLERIISASCPPHGLVLDCFMGSGTTIEASERLGRRWIGIDCGKYAVHLARKRLIQLHGQPRPPEKPEHDYVECEHCKNIERKTKPQRSPGTFDVRAFTMENMGVYQRAEEWNDFQIKRSRYRDEMIKVFGGEPLAQSPLLHGRKGNAWVHVGPLDGPVSENQVWSIAREAQRTNTKAVTILSADFDTISGGEKDGIKEATGVAITVRVIPSAALEEVRRRIEIADRGVDSPIESMAVPAFYAPLSIVLAEPEVKGRTVRLTLERCEVDIESFLASQRPVDAKPISESMTHTQRKKAEEAKKKWDARRETLEDWLNKADSWKKFVDFWAVDWNYSSRMSPTDKPIFETDWQSFRLRKNKGELEPLVFTAEFQYTEPGRYWIAARVTDVFGNDGIATVEVTVK